MPVEYLGVLLAELSASLTGERHRTVASSSTSAPGEGSGSGSGTSGQRGGGGGVRERPRADAVLLQHQWRTRAIVKRLWRHAHRAFCGGRPSLSS